MKKIVIGTRGSNLAIIQANLVKDAIELHSDYEVLIQKIKTAGDLDLKTPIRKIQDKGFYTKEIEKSLFDGDIDFAVHSMKDLPTKLQDQFTIGAVLERQSPMDILVVRKDRNNQKIESFSKIGVGSIRRRIQIKNIVPNSKLFDIRGNIETRLKNIESQNLDGIIMAKAAYSRLRREEKYHEFSINEMIPAPCQGIIAVEVLKRRTEFSDILKSINHERTLKAAMMEQKISNMLEGGCSSPLGCLVELNNQVVSLHIFISDVNGNNQINENYTFDISQENLFGQIFQDLKNKGLNKILI